MGSNNTLEISEIFSSLQGESTFAGLPCVFIRLSGCNLHCSYCDSRYAIEERGRIMTVDEVLDSITDYPGFLVEITGGEPLLQQNVYDLIEKLLVQGKTVLIETNGSLDIAAIPIEATIIMDIKCPGSGSPSLHPDNLNTIRRRASLRPGSSEIKFVLSGLDDYTWAKDMVLVNAIPCFAPVLFSPVRDLLPVKDLAEAILRDRLQVRLQLQLHTIIWPEKSRGI
jgi:7-carboxy-7-deazaguanine synthase